MLLVACHGKPQFINHPQPNLSVTFDVFNDVGCPKGEYGFRSCNSDSPLASLGCNEIRKPSDLIGGLLPSYPITVCEVYLVPDKTKTETEAEIENLQYFYSSGGTFRTIFAMLFIEMVNFFLLILK